jgi:hypothetical protein
MDQKIIEKKCHCGQVTCLVESKEGLRYFAEKHGTDALCENRCFNCHKPLDKPKPAAAPAQPAAAGPEAKEAAGSVYTEKELLNLAKSQFDLDLAKSSSKSIIIDAILDAQDQGEPDEQ